MPGPKNLLELAEPDMKLVGRFSCGACKMYCSIDRFEVAGRRFPFGGRCSLYESVWKRKAHSQAAPDLVEERTSLLFGSAHKLPVMRPLPPPEQRWSVGQVYESARSFLESSFRRGAGTLELHGRQIGIPRALTTHSLYPLFSTFFTGLGLEVVLSSVDPRGELRSHSGFCFPVQIAHGAVLDLDRRGVRLVFLPHVTRMPQPNPCRDSYLCPITQAGPYFLSKAFPQIRFLSPVLDFTQGYADCPALVELAIGELGMRREVAEEAWAEAVRVQLDVENGMRQLGERALEQAMASGQPAILLAGHSYNAFSPEASQSVGKKLASMGVTVIPADCLLPTGEGTTAWHFANQILNAVAICRQHPKLFLLCVSNFSCTVDAFTHAKLAAEMGSKPYLILEIDAHTADAGVQTRLEAFLDIIRNYNEGEAHPAEPFSPCRLSIGARVIRSNGERVALGDPRVKLYFPDFSRYHSQSFAMAMRWLGLHAGERIALDRRQLDRGLQYTSGRECLPLPICIGQLLELHEKRQPAEIAGLYMIRGGAPCVIDAYQGYLERFIAEQRLPDLFLFVPSTDNDFCGFDETTLARHLSTAVLAADILVEIEQVVQVVGARGSVERLRDEWQQFVASAGSLDQFHAELPGLVDRLAALPRTRDPFTCPRVVVTGDFFTRFSPFFIEGVHDLYAKRGIILKPVDLSDLVLYITYHGVAGTAQTWGMKPGCLALAKACTRVFQPDGQQYLQQWLGYQAERRWEDYYRGMFRRTGLIVTGPNDVATLFERASEHVSPSIYGEIIPTVGKGLGAESEGYDGIILIGPFNCLPFRISEAILKPLCMQRGMPIFTYESDGYAVSPAVLRQVDVHIQQVLDHAAEKELSTAREHEWTL